MTPRRVVKLAGTPLGRSRHLCAFFLDREEKFDNNNFGGRVVIDILCTHPVSIVGKIVHENPFYVPPAELLQELRSRDS